MKNQKSVVDLLSVEIIQKLTLPSNWRYGQAIFKRSAAEFIEFQPLKVEGWIGGLSGSMSEGGGSRRRTQLFATTKGLAWHCSGNPKDHQIFCKHCVALALAVLDQ